MTQPTQTMTILVLGSGGREHALAWKIAQSEQVDRLFIAPGNGGTDKLQLRNGGTSQNVPLNPNDFASVGTFAINNNVGMIVVGPEQPLVDGIYDYFSSQPQLKHISVIGPSAQAAQLEGSKDFAKQFMLRHGIPTAAYRTFTADTVEEGLAFLTTLQPPYVLKADGLCAGKGVLILQTLEEAQRELRAMLDGMFGQASARVVVEEFLSGTECSVFAITDGKDYKLLPEAKDYKRIGNGDTGPNTGGMGSVSPVPFANKEWMKKVEEQIVQPTVRGLAADGLDYRGFIFFGLINCNGQPKVIEYNCRMGDPETETVMLRLKTDLVDLLKAVAQRTLNKQQVETDPRSAVCVILASGGYPGSYNKGYQITHHDDNFGPDTVVFHAGTTHSSPLGEAGRGPVITSGGRVLAVSSYGSTRAEALKRSFEAANTIQFTNKYFRTDIGEDLAEH